MDRTRSTRRARAVYLISVRQEIGRPSTSFTSATILRSDGLDLIGGTPARSSRSGTSSAGCRRSMYVARGAVRTRLRGGRRSIRRHRQGGGGVVGGGGGGGGGGGEASPSQTMGAAAGVPGPRLMTARPRKLAAAR